jgi:hypothetical protein
MTVGQVNDALSVQTTANSLSLIASIASAYRSRWMASASM